MELRISSPCPKSWDELRGDDRVRACDLCRQNVYNLADMSRKDVEALARRTSGRLCGRLYLRGDRTATLRDCSKSRERLILRRTAAAAAILGLAAFGWIFRGMAGPDRSALPSWARTVVDLIDPEPPPRRCSVVGLITLPKPPASTPPPPAPPNSSP